MGIEFVEDTDICDVSGEFLPPAVIAVRHSGRSAFAVIINIVLLVVAAALCVCGLSVGLPILVLGLMLLTVEITGFVRSKGTAGGYGLILRRNCYLVAAVLLFGFAVFSESHEPYYEYRDMLEPLYGFAKELPKPFSNIIGVGFMGEFIICSALSAGFLAIGLSYGSLNRSKRQNLPFSKTLFFSVVLSVLASAVLVCDGLGRLHVLPSNYIYEDWTQSLVISRYCDTGISFGFGAAVLLSAIRLLITYIRMRKVRNAVLKAKI